MSRLTPLKCASLHQNLAKAFEAVSLRSYRALRCTGPDQRAEQQTSDRLRRGDRHQDPDMEEPESALQGCQDQRDVVDNKNIRGTSLPVAKCLCFHPCSCRRLFESLVEHMQVRTHHAQLHAPHKPTKKAWGCTYACTYPAWWCVVDLRGC
jgi:hypothetical protein